MSKKDGKLTVKHYLNKRAKSKSMNGEHFYPLYLQLIVSGQKAQLKSKIHEFLNVYRAEINKFSHNHSVNDLLINGYFTENLLEKIENERIFPFYQILKDEIHVLNFIISAEQPFSNNSFSLVNISSNYDLYLKDIQQLLNEAVKKYYLDELNRIFLESTKNEDNKKIFKVVNFFIHYINWANNFCDYYQTTYELLPTEIKFIENYITKEMKLQIKAALAFQSRVNYLIRFLDKKQKGLFPNINIIDWKESGKEFMLKEFTAIFGKQKANEYIISIDFMLSTEIRHPLKIG